MGVFKREGSPNWYIEFVHEGRRITEQTRDPGGTIGTILRALVDGVRLESEAELVEMTVKLWCWLMRTPIPGEPPWLLADLVHLQRDLKAAVDHWPTLNVWPSIPPLDRALALANARAGRIVHRQQLSDEYTTRGLKDTDLDGDLAELKHRGYVLELLGGYWRFND